MPATPRTSLWLALPLTAAVSSTATSMTLPEFVTDVVSNHPALQQEIHSYRQVVQDQTIASKGWRPTVDLSASTGLYDTESPVTGQQRRDYNSNQIGLTVTQNLFEGFNTTNQIKQYDARLASAVYRLYDKADNLALEATRAYLDVLKQQELLALAVENVTAHERIYAKISERTRSGVGRRSEEEQTAGRLAQARSSLIAQKNNLNDSLTVLHRYLGRYVNSSELEHPASPVGSEAPLEAIVERALQNHPAMRVARLNVAASKANYDRARSSFLPRVDLQLRALNGEDLSGYNGQTEDYSVALNLTYNLYNGGADRAERMKRLSAVHEYSEFANGAHRNIIESLRLAWMADQTLNEQVTFLEEYVKRADQTARAYQEEVFLGRRDLTDLLDAKSELNNAEKSLTEAQYGLISARFRVQEGFGQLFEALGLNVVIDEDNLRLFEADVARTDDTAINNDHDGDQRETLMDECDNSLAGASVSQYGCSSRPEVVIPEPELLQEEITFVNNRAQIIENLHFRFDAAELVPESLAHLNTIVEKLKRVGDAEITVVAHTDSKGADAYNLKLSQRRAEAVLQALVAGGLDARRLDAVGMGEAEPIADNSTEAGRAQNRRVEFRIQKLVSD